MLLVCSTVLGQGRTIGLQLLQNDLWVGCAGRVCAGATCPGVFFEGSDWQNCWGEVFEIYRALGSGNIVSGDFVGLYYPRERKWFSMWEGYGRKLTCPGAPSQEYGFEDEDRWYLCGGEVFRVYAKGKSIGDTITDQDTLSFYYYTVDIKNVRFLPNGINLSECMLDLSDRKRPPSNHAFDQCKYESVEITIYD